MPNGYSKVTWVEHVEIEDKTLVHRLFRNLVYNGMAFGAQRWLAVLQRMCERLACLTVTENSTRDLGGVSNGSETFRGSLLFCCGGNQCVEGSGVLLLGVGLECPLIKERLSLFTPAAVVAGVGYSFYLIGGFVGKVKVCHILFFVSVEYSECADIAGTPPYGYCQSAVSGLNRGLAANEDDLRKADVVAKELETAGGLVDLLADLDKLQGRWRLIYSSAFSSRTLGGSRPGPPTENSFLSLLSKVKVILLWTYFENDLVCHQHFVQQLDHDQCHFHLVFGIVILFHYAVTEVPDNVFLLEGCPHDWLFPQCSAMVHHGGARTTTTRLKAGVMFNIVATIKRSSKLQCLEEILCPFLVFLHSMLFTKQFL
ncbi:hypothetical protein AHAS_Ahas19G0236700 [Arachis hypogaea]